MSSSEKKQKLKKPVAGIQPYAKSNLNARQKWQRYGASPDKKKATFYETMKSKIWG